MYSKQYCNGINWERLAKCHGKNGYGNLRFEFYRRSCEKHKVRVDVASYHKIRKEVKNKAVCQNRDKAFSIAFNQQLGWPLYNCEESIDPDIQTAIKEGGQAGQIYNEINQIQSKLNKKDYSSGFLSVVGVEASKSDLEKNMIKKQKRLDSLLSSYSRVESPQSCRQ